MKNSLIIKKIVLIAFLVIIIISFILVHLEISPADLVDVLGVGMGLLLYRLGLYSEFPFKTSKEHMKRLDIKIVQLPPKDEQTIHSMIKDYYETKFISALERSWREELATVDDPVIKEDYEARLSLLRKLKILKIEFSQPRKYRDLKDRIGIITFISKTDPPNFLGGYPRDIFILKRVGDRWEIEKRWEIMFGPVEKEEWYLITNYEDIIKKGSQK